MKKLLLIIFLPFLTGVLFAQINSLLRIENESTRILFSVLIFIISGLIAFSIAKPKSPRALLWIYIQFTLSWLLWDLTIRLIEGWNDSFATLPRALCELAGLYLAYQLYSNKVKNILLGFLVLTLSLFISIQYLYPLANNYTNYGTYTNNVNINATADWHIKSGGKSLSNEYSRDQYILIDFWSRSCGVCYKKLPILDELYKTQNNKNNIKILSVLIQYNNTDSTVAINRIKPKNYSFPIAFADSATAKTFNIISFPTVVIIHDGKIIYKGAIEEAIKHLSHEKIK